LNRSGLEGPWDHFDLFPHRCTSQPEFLKFVNYVPGYKEDAFRIFQHYLLLNSYKLVCVLNGGATSILLDTNFSGFIQFNAERVALDGIRNKKYGFYRGAMDDKLMKFFFFKMISGRGQPDKEEKVFL
jgi:hypothetical protein